MHTYIYIYVDVYHIDHRSVAHAGQGATNVRPQIVYCLANERSA
jgi:hypothetical protein